MRIFLIANKYSLNIMHHNIRSLNNKIKDLQLYIQVNSPDVITLNETGKINKNSKIKGYTLSKPEIHSGKGVAIFYKNELKVSPLEDITPSVPSYNIQHSILITTPTDKIQISTVYCPKGKPNIELINGILKREPLTILTGDFNCQHDRFGHKVSDKGGKELIDIIDKYKYIKLNNNEPTCRSDISGKEDVKDLMFSSPDLFKIFNEFRVGEDLGSDHRITHATFNHQNILYDVPPKIINLYHKADWQLINETITTLMINKQINNTSSCKDIDESITNLTDIIDKTLDKHVKKITIKPKRIGLNKLNLNVN